MNHELKIWPKFYEAIISGEKTFEARRNDRGFKVGDYLILKEWDNESGRYTGRGTIRRVTHILDNYDFGVRHGFVIMALNPQIAKVEKEQTEREMGRSV